MKIFRPTRHETGLIVAFAFAQRATCSRRQAGCLLVNSAFRMIGGGYNGPHPGAEHCQDTPCPGAGLPSGTGLDSCEAIHAEQNALMYCSDVSQIATAYTTCSPCIHCVKLLLGTACQEIVFCDEYPHSASRDLWLKAGRAWTQIPGQKIQYWVKKIERKSDES